jgi:hypothetical protein
MRTSGSWGSTPASRKNEDEVHQVGACSSLRLVPDAQVLAVTWPKPDVHHRSSPARSCLSRDQRAPRRSFMLTWSPMRLTARPTPCPRRAASSTRRVQSRPFGGPRFELAGQPVGFARPPAGPVHWGREPMGLSARLFLLSADSTLHAMANAAFMRMLRRKTVSHIPGFAGPRVRLASALHFLRSRHRCQQFAGCRAFHRPAIRPRGRPVRTCGPSAGSRGPLSMQPFVSSSKAASGSPIGPSCAASNWQCWGN